MKKAEVVDRVIGLVARLDEGINTLGFSVRLSSSTAGISGVIVGGDGRASGIHIAPRCYHRYDPARLDALVVHELSFLACPVSESLMGYDRALANLEGQGLGPEAMKQNRLQVRFQYEIGEKLLVDMTARKLWADRLAIEAMKRLGLDLKGYPRFLRTERRLACRLVMGDTRRRAHIAALDLRLKHAEDIILGEASTEAYTEAFSKQLEELAG
jgi:hypothetical protein